ncbi:MAG: nickel insertion protein [Candidatus Jordarchaeum sp.]|uniref:nickel insertion protein n=1 Tax=Candidatus Jordarchaeum sp. TaxID=2823881 RepID=UPI00404B150A
MLIMVNVDNISGETASYVIEGVIEKGAYNVHVVQALTKKRRLEYLFFVEVEERHFEEVSLFLFSELGTLGLKILESKHVKFDYEQETVNINLKGRNLEERISVKVIKNKEGKTLSVCAEFEDVAKIVKRLANQNINIPLRKLKKEVEISALKEEKDIDINQLL